MRARRARAGAYGISVLLFHYIILFLYKKVVWMS
jgi:hypothetical protein